MALQISISPKAEAKLRAKAAEVGQELSDYAAGVLERAAEAALPLTEISGPLHAEFKASGMTDDELGDLLEDAKHRMRRQRRASK
jgi:hypothetical protein